ncbi:MAG: MltA domain-containing protein [Bdellovibrionota bacterium]
MKHSSLKYFYFWFRIFWNLSWVLALIWTVGCGRSPLVDPTEAMRRVDAPELSDDLDLGQLFLAIEREIRFLAHNASVTEFRFGPDLYSKKEYLAGLAHFVALGRSAPDRNAFYSQVKSEFAFYEVYGRKKWGEVFITSYFEPLISGSLKKTAKYSQPLYATPPGIMSLDLALFDPRFSDERKMRVRRAGRDLLPFYTREEIDSKNALKGKGLELVWVDPLDGYFLQVQGSGTISMGKGITMRLNYSDKNGAPYEGIGKFVKQYLPPEQVNMHTIEAFLRRTPKEAMQRFMNLNPSYVFFKKTKETALTSLGVEATDGRTIATDKKFFPKGAIAFLSFEKPVFTSKVALLPERVENTARFVLDQDIGGAITGGGRVDLFWGRGEEAKLYAGSMKNQGRLYYLAPKRVVKK